MHQPPQTNAAAEKDVDIAAAWYRENYGQDLPRLFDDAFHYQKTGERRMPPIADQHKALKAKG